jgi:hypothetical protein
MRQLLVFSFTLAALQYILLLMVLGWATTVQVRHWNLLEDYRELISKVQELEERTLKYEEKLNTSVDEVRSWWVIDSRNIKKDLDERFLELQQEIDDASPKSE